MKKVILFVLVFVILTMCLAGCNETSTKNNSNEIDNITSAEKTSKEKAINYIINNGREYESGFFVSFQDYFLDDYNTYFIVYNIESDSFRIEYYSSDRYFDIPPKFDETNQAVTINLSNGEAKYYWNRETNIYTGTASIDILTYSKNNTALQHVVINGSEYKPIINNITETFGKMVQNTITYVNLLLVKANADISVIDLGFVAFSK